MEPALGSTCSLVVLWMANNSIFLKGLGSEGFCLGPFLKGKTNVLESYV